MNQFLLGLISGTMAVKIVTVSIPTEYPKIENMNPPVGQCSGVVVAVIDTGIDYNHVSLRNNLWKNVNEIGAWTPPKGMKTTCRDKSCNGLDDDNNGYIDDVIGWDFVNDTPLPYDVHGHGTHVSGIINDICPTSIMALKYYSNDGLGYNNLPNTVRAIKYAVSNGANVINYSGGGPDEARSERLALSAAQRAGVLVVAAAGNDGRNNDRRHYYPASYKLNNIISVASHNRYGTLLPSSNFGKTVHLAAPGIMITSTLPENKFGTMSGTSQAAPHVTGLAVLLGVNKKNYLKVKGWILKGATPYKYPQALGYGTLNPKKSVELSRE